LARSDREANRTLGGIEATGHQGQDGGQVNPANGREHGIAAVALLSRIQTDGMIFRLQRRRLFALGRRPVLLNMTQLLKI
jgi:hypothetical protein